MATSTSEVSPPYDASACAIRDSLCPTSSAPTWYASAVSMRVIPASRAAWMVAMERASSGRPSIDIGMPPSPMALTLASPIWRGYMVVSLLVGSVALLY